MRTYIIYLYKSPSGKCYVGKTYNERMRKYYHAYEVRKGSMYPFHCALRKYGIENFEYKVIVEGVPHYMVNAFEKYWIRYYNAVENGYNCTIGGDGLQSPSQATRDKIGAASIGRKHTQESKDAISKSSKGKKLSAEHIEKLKKPKTEAHRIKAALAKCKHVLCIETGIVYASLMLANVAVGLSSRSANITSVCKGRRHTAGGYHWKYYNKDINE